MTSLNNQECNSHVLEFKRIVLNEGTRGINRNEAGDNFVSHHFNSVVTKRSNPHIAVTKRSKRVKSINWQRRKSFAGMSDKPVATVQGESFVTDKPVADHSPASAKLTIPATRAMAYATGQYGKRHFNPAGRMECPSDMLARGSDEKTKAANLSVRLHRVPVAVQLNQLLAHKQKLITQADKAARIGKIHRASNLIRQIELNEAVIKSLVLELQENDITPATVNSAFADYMS